MFAAALLALLLIIPTTAKFPSLQRLTASKLGFASSQDLLQFVVTRTARSNAKIGTDFESNWNWNWVEAFEAERHTIPAPYYRLVAAGLQCGRLPAALEGLTRNARSIKRLRLQLSTALVYPLFICGLTYGLLIFYSVHLTPIFRETYSSSHVPPGSGLRVAMFLRRSLPFWIALPPCLLGMGIVIWRHHRSSDLLSLGGWTDPMRWIPGMRRSVEEYRCAHFSEMLALMVSHGVRLEQGVVLAADASGSQRLQHAVNALTQSDANHQTWDEQTSGLRDLPPFLGWSLSQETDRRRQVHSLRMASEMYRHNAEQRADRSQMLIPIVGCVVIAGGAALGYALLLFVPLTQLLQTMFDASTTA